MRSRLRRPVPRVFLLLGVLLLALDLASQGARASDTGDIFALNRSLGRGINVLGYDPIWKSPGEARFKEADFAVIRSGGFETLRVNLYPFAHMGGAPDYALEDSWWNTADWIVSRALAVDLNVILDLHEYGAMGKDPEGNKARFLMFWSQAARHFRDAPRRVVFEVLNEPNNALTPDAWNGYLAAALVVIRSSNPDRPVIIGPAYYNSVKHLADLSLPERDRNLIVTVHYYLPMEFTHQGASWTKTRYPVGTAWKGTAAERAAVEADFASVQAWSERNQRPIFLGEFGAYDKGDMASRARYTDCVARTAEKFGWSWAYWQFDADFIAFDVGTSSWVPEIHAALVPGSEAALRTAP
jgi:endoglucanase